MVLVVFLQEDEDVPNVYRNLKIFCETAPGTVSIQAWTGYIVNMYERRIVYVFFTFRANEYNKNNMSKKAYMFFLSFSIAPMLIDRIMSHRKPDIGYYNFYHNYIV